MTRSLVSRRRAPLAAVAMLLAGAGGAAVAPAAAQAAGLTVTGTCFAAGEPVALSGSAFTPGAAVALGGAVTAAAQADALGTFAVQVPAPPVPGVMPRVATITAVDQGNPANTATLRLRVVRRAFGSNFPVAGRPQRRTTWRFAGFAPGRPIYGHFRLRGRPMGTHRFGVARGRCGTLVVRARHVPVDRVRPGGWTLKLDQRAADRPGTPGSTAGFRIVRRLPL
jgi:hypothetical protein